MFCSLKTLLNLCSAKQFLGRRKSSTPLIGGGFFISDFLDKDIRIAINGYLRYGGIPILSERFGNAYLPRGLFCSG